MDAVGDIGIYISGVQLSNLLNPKTLSQRGLQSCEAGSVKILLHFPDPQCQILEDIRFFKSHQLQFMDRGGFGYSRNAL